MTGTMATEADLQRTVDALRRELEARTAELAEARAERAATAEILEVINSSPADLDAGVRSDPRAMLHALCGVAHGSLQILRGRIRSRRCHTRYRGGPGRYPAAPLPVAEAPTFQALLQGAALFQVDRRDGNRTSDSSRRRSFRAREPSSPCPCAAKEAPRDDCLRPPRGEAVHGAGDQPARKLRRPGGDRDRECAAVQRGAGQDPRPRRGAAIPDRQRQHPQRDRLLADRRAAGAEGDRRKRLRAVRGL